MQALLLTFALAASAHAQNPNAQCVLPVGFLVVFKAKGLVETKAAKRYTAKDLTKTYDKISNIQDKDCDRKQMEELLQESGRKLEGCMQKGLEPAEKEAYKKMLPEAGPDICSKRNAEIQGTKLTSIAYKLAELVDNGRIDKKYDADAACKIFTKEYADMGKALESSVAPCSDKSTSSSAPQAGATKPACEIPDADGDCPGAPKSPKAAAPIPGTNGVPQTWDLRPNQDKSTNSISK